jgi:hypothetical protein
MKDNEHLSEVRSTSILPRAITYDGPKTQFWSEVAKLNKK